MNIKTILIFIAAGAFFTFAANYRFYDSAHAIGTIGIKVGKPRHAALLERGRENYTLIATAGVIPPYHGNARVALEGDPALAATFFNSEPALDLGIHRHPRFRDNTYFDLRPGDRIALWVRIKRTAAPQSRQTAPERSGKSEHAIGPPGTLSGRGMNGGTAERSKGPVVAFYDIASNEPLLKIPIRFRDVTGGGDNGH